MYNKNYKNNHANHFNSTNKHNSGAESNSKSEAKMEKDQQKKRSYKPQPVYQVIRKAMRLFLKQLKPDIQAKKDCLQLALAQSPQLYEDKLRFYMDFKAERDRLLDSKRFNEACIAMKLDATAVADNVVFEGKTILERVLKEGLLVVMGEKVHMFNETLWEDTENLYTSKSNSQQIAEEGVNE